jgi:di/tricarboxylate transporter
MQVNYYAILVCGILAMVFGYLWYGPLFGKKWLQVVGATKLDLEARKKMEANVWKLYLLQFLLALFQVWVLAYYIQGWEEASGLTNALWIWAAFVVPVIAGTAMWNNDSAKISWTRFLLQAGYQLICFVAFGLILGAW